MRAAEGSSEGLFQQRTQWWGTTADRMDPARSAALFYNALSKRNYNDTSRSPGSVAQSVQQSAFPDRYDARYAEAEALYNRLANVSADPIDPIEELIMTNPAVESLSIYATAGEPDVPLIKRIQFMDKMLHEGRTEARARMGLPDDIDRLVRTARGLGKYTDQGAIDSAVAALASIAGKTPDQIKQELKNGAAA